MTKKNRKPVGKTLRISYRVRTFLQKPVPFFVGALIINIPVVYVILVYFRGILSLAPSSALQVLASIVESSSTILAIFFALVIFLLERRPSDLRRTLGKGEFFSACFFFSLSIVFGLNSMMIIEPDKRVDGNIILAPAYLLLASLFYLFLFVYGFFRKSCSIQS